jgi:predicted DsbA family dithiol-disulfide isomerase
VAIVYTYYYTDPACPWSWALEPALRKLIAQLGDSLRFTYVMCGMAREFGDAGALVAESLQAGDRSLMPVDPRLWLQAPPRSSYPACIAVKAAADQGDPAPYLRRLREGLLCRRRKLDTSDALVEEARMLSAMDLERFRIDLGSHAILEAFAADLERAAAASPEHHFADANRPVLPSLEFIGPGGEVHGVYGFSGYEQLHTAAIAAGAQPTGVPPPSVQEALRRFGTMATSEIAMVCELPGPRAPAEMWRLASEWTVKSERVGSGELWSLA